MTAAVLPFARSGMFALVADAARRAVERGATYSEIVAVARSTNAAGQAPLADRAVVGAVDAAIAGDRRRRPA